MSNDEIISNLKNTILQTTLDVYKERCKKYEKIFKQIREDVEMTKINSNSSNLYIKTYNTAIDNVLEIFNLYDVMMYKEEKK